MKKIFFVLLGIILASSVFAQEKQTSFEVGMQAGISTLTNYPALSLYQDDDPSYSTWNEAFLIGLRSGNNLWGLQYQNTLFNTSAYVINEQAVKHDIGVLYRHYIPLRNSFETFGGFRLNLTLLENRYLGTDYNSERRWGSFATVELGVGYRLANGGRFGVVTGVDFMGTVSAIAGPKPAPLAPSNRNLIGGHFVAFSYSFTF